MSHKFSSSRQDDTNINARLCVYRRGCNLSCAKCHHITNQLDFNYSTFADTFVWLCAA